MHAFAVDLARGWEPLSFDRDANPNGVGPAILTDGGGAFLRLAVAAGAYLRATRGEPGRCDRCEVREPDKIAMTVESWHGFALRVPLGFPSVARRFVAAQLKANGGGSPLFAIRVDSGRLFADWRFGQATVELHELGCGEWIDIVLGLTGDRGELWIDGRHIASARAAFADLAPTRYLKLGPYRDSDPAWGADPAAIDFRDIRRGASRSQVLSDRG